MSRVFEAFVGNFLRRHRAGLGLSDVEVELQEGGRHLMRDENRKRYFGLYPDVLGKRTDGSIAFVLDTKWKLLRGGGRVDDISMSDAYQIYAYGERFDAPLNVLLYPYVEGARDVDLLFEGSDRLLRVGFVNVSRDLRKHEAELVATLAAILSPTYRQQTDRVTA
jgi:5-methylcytosine-specific restriction endonuclease McrBC regulatory subunit McrC